MGFSVACLGDLAVSEPLRRALFLGATYNPLSTACLAAVADIVPEVIVADHDATRGSAVATLRRMMRESGLRGVIERTVLVGSARARIALRGLRLPLSGATSVREVCVSRGLPRLNCADPNVPEFVKVVRALNVDVIVMANYPKILRRPLFSLPPLGTINVHPSMLPAYRGPHPLRSVIARGERQTGVTVHQVDAGIDSGPILAQRPIDVGPGGEAALMRRSASVAADLLR
jgi:methionyl-tRNA formyltransferase